jgi:hypothetical protein
MPADEPAGKDAVGSHADAEVATGGEDLVLDPARDEGVLDLEIGHRADAVSTANRLRADFREAYVMDIALVDQLGDRADGLLDRDVGVDPAEPVDVDVVRVESSQGVPERVLDRLRAAVDPEDLSAGCAQQAELDAQEHVLAVAAAQRLTQEQLVVARSVVVAGVEQADAGVESGVDRRDALGLVRGAVQGGHAHAAETDR